MSDDEFSPDEKDKYEYKDIHLRLRELSKDQPQYRDYVMDTLLDLPLLCLWDDCYLFARYIYYSVGVPEGLLNKDDTSKPDEETASIVLFQKKLAELLSASIDKGEIKPIILRRSFDGKIDAKQTYVDVRQIDEWLACRGLDELDSGHDFYGDFELFDVIERITYSVLNASRLFAASLYDPDFKMPEQGAGDYAELHTENARLRAQIRNQSNHPQRKPHGNVERFAKNREEVLGAALAVVVKLPDQCKNDSSGKFEVTKIAKLIDDKGLLFWPDTGEPPLSREKMEREISKWLKVIG
jgi:hypothetical protein